MHHSVILGDHRGLVSVRSLGQSIDFREEPFGQTIFNFRAGWVQAVQAIMMCCIITSHTGRHTHTHTHTLYDRNTDPVIQS